MLNPISKIDSAFKITIPVQLRKICDLNSGSYIKWFVNDDKSITIKQVEIVEK